MIDDYEIDFLEAIGEVTEYTGKELSYDEVAQILNAVGITTGNGEEYSGGRGTARYLSRAASQASDNGDEEGAELIRDITGVPDNEYDDDDDEEDEEEDDDDDDWNE